MIAIVFLMSAFVGATLGIYSFVLLEMLVCIVTLLNKLHVGFGPALLRSVETACIMNAGFISALIACYLMPALEFEKAHLRSQLLQRVLNRTLMRLNRPH